MDDKQPLGQSTDRTAGRKQKKPFEPPRLHVYGDISTLTRMIGQTGLADGGNKTTSKTRP
jgi:hypothetical protein